jgi:hypothetical protein
MFMFYVINLISLHHARSHMTENSIGKHTYFSDSLLLTSSTVISATRLLSLSEN